jgi:hypothetical protein
MTLMNQYPQVITGNSTWSEIVIITYYDEINTFIQLQFLRR